MRNGEPKHLPAANAVGAATDEEMDGPNPYSDLFDCLLREM